MQDKIVSTELNKVLSGPLAPAATNDISRQASLVISGGTTAAADGAAGAGQTVLADALTQNTAQLNQVHSTLQGQLDSLVANTQAVIDNTTTKSAGSTVANLAGGVASSVLGGGLLGPIVSGLMSLFGGNSNNQTPAPLAKFALPPKVDYQGGLQASSTGGVDYGQNGQPRSTTPAASSQSQQQIIVNVSAMDSRSFLDHSGDIANAVRRAMLESSSLNDVIGEM
jgi:hypothetical protein